jgi:hypothetical protein
MPRDADQQPPENDNRDADRPNAARDGPVQTRKSSEGAAPERQIAQEPQQSSGLGSGQS